MTRVRTWAKVRSHEDYRAVCSEAESLGLSCDLPDAYTGSHPKLRLRNASGLEALWPIASSPGRQNVGAIKARFRREMRRIGMIGERTT